MVVVERACRWLAFGIVAGVLVLAPWLFGGWEAWWFWPLATLLFVATGCFALSLLAGRGTATPAPRVVGWWLAACMPFVAYGAVRAFHTPVLLDAERSFLMVLTPLLIGAILAYGTTADQRRALFGALLLNLLLLGLYGIVNHIVTGSRLVLWEAGYPQYWEDHRATGSYYCPDHFSGIMEIAFGAGLALVLRARRAPRPLLLGGLLAAVGALGVVMSKSRGGGLTLVVVLVAAMVWGLSHLPRASRPWWRVAVLFFLTAAMLMVPVLAKSYTARFRHALGLDAAAGKPTREALRTMWAYIESDSRPQMFASAYRAWRTRPWLGIGPGMHETLWPHFGPGTDGDRAAHRWPRYPNLNFNSNAVHNDWLQLLEEYGAIGFMLFAVPAAWCLALLRRPLADEAARLEAGRAGGPGHTDRTMILAALLAAAAMGFHSLLDFNMQMPGTNWMVAALIAIALAAPAPARALAGGAEPEAP